MDKVKNSRWVQFFEGEDERLSMTRLLCFLSFFPSSYVVIATKGENALGWYLGAYVLGYIGGKGADVLMKPRKEAKIEESRTDGDSDSH